MSDAIFEQIKDFVEEQRWRYPFDLQRTTTLEKDLGITGDDAVEFLVAFGKEFNVDISNFMADEYFKPEGDKILPAIIRYFTGQKKVKSKELSLADLERAIIAGRLDESVIEISGNG
ncbi:DUF1493 family protein [Pararcticibacter amylolyticus]|uniref:DUF1493 domain-containing protein n=1 Tax=Pararcticibacter amylolyticus TaxID=2173175 RepID=A0A2U2P980_9SPHI|nr:DUF1493 family protein [Pararcticibacter amylolyticus]PWG77933.1 hypothetical protein DDR33_24910 [Pararcticibacter amylolyticus]